MNIFQHLYEALDIMVNMRISFYNSQYECVAAFMGRGLFYELGGAVKDKGQQ